MNSNEKQCPYCGEIIKAEAKKCRYCGEYIEIKQANNQNNKNAILISVITLLFVLTMVNLFIFISPKNNSDNKNIDTNVEEQETMKTPKVVQNQQNYSDILNKIDRYQAQYWQIVKRSDVIVWLHFNSDEVAEDSADLKRLEKTVISQINKNNIYLKKYYNIINNYVEINGETTIDESVQAGQNCDAIDRLLNEVYQVLRKKLPPEDFEKLKQSEIIWIKNCDKYKNYLVNSDKYGSWGRHTGRICAETYLKEFRTLLLLLYLQ